VATVIPEGLATLGLLCQMLMKLVPGAKNQIILADMEFGRFEKEGVDFVKKPNDGKMKGLAFIKDPDGYWIEILSPHTMASAL